MQTRPLHRGNEGYTLLEVLIAILVAGTLTGSALAMLSDGFKYTNRFTGWFRAQTSLTRVVDAISFGYGSFPGSAGAMAVVIPSANELHIVYNSTDDRIVYWLDGDTLKRNRRNAANSVVPGSDEVLLTGVDSVSFQLDGQALLLDIRLREAPEKKALRVQQRVLIRNV